MKKETPDQPMVKPSITYQDQLVLLLKTVKSLGVNVDIIVLDLILSLYVLVKDKKADVSLNDIEQISRSVVIKYQEQEQKQ